MKTRKLNLEQLESRQLLTAVPELVLDIQAGVKASNIQELYEFDGEVYFRADDGQHGSELWKTDGTAGGTVMVKDLNPGEASSIPGWFTEFRGELYFAALDGSGDELWKTDGTSAGTMRVADINAGEDSSRPSILTVLGDQLLFAATTDTGDELWTSDGTSTGTEIVRDIRTGRPGSDPGFFSGLVVLGDHIYFNARTDNEGDELWKSDGTLAGTEIVIDIESGDRSSFPFNLFLHNGDLYFAAEQEAPGFDRLEVFLFKVDGDTGEAKRVADIPVDFNQGFFAYKDHLYFAGFTEELGTELYRSNGDETELFNDILPGTMGSQPRGFHEFAGNLYFVAGDTVDPENEAVIPRLWRTDGTSAFTFRVSENEVDHSNGMLAYNDELYFTSTDDSNGFELYKIGSGFADRPALVKDIYEGSESSAPRPLTVLDDQLVFIAQADRLGYESTLR